jgi:Fe-S cluster biosynthesis and repair protein YggX
MEPRELNKTEKLIRAAVSVYVMRGLYAAASRRPRAAGADPPRSRWVNPVRTLLANPPSHPMSDPTIRCRRCGKDAAPLLRPPFRNELGERILAEVCADCWKEWLQHQTLLINHYGLDPRERRAREFLYEQIEQILFEGEEGREIDTSQQGSIEW